MKAAKSAIKLLLPILLVVSREHMADAGGTINLANTIQSRVIGAPTNAQIVYGVFWGTNRDALTLALPLAGTSGIAGSGLIVAPSVYQIPGTERDQKVYLQIRGWSAEYGTDWMRARDSFAIFGETDIRQVTLGAEAGPGQIIWQSTAGINISRFYPLVLGYPFAHAAASFGSQPNPNPSLVLDEGNHDAVDAVLTVFRFGEASILNLTSTVMIATCDMSAVGGQDYVPISVPVVFAPGETARQIAIRITPDALPEPDEQFAVRLIPTGDTEVFFETLIVTIREARLASVRREANHAVATLRTTSSQRYALESSNDLTNWSTIPGANNIAGTGGNVEVVDPAEDCCGRRFYRMRLVP